MIFFLLKISGNLLYLSYCRNIKKKKGLWAIAISGKRLFLLGVKWKLPEDVLPFNILLKTQNAIVWIHTLTTDDDDDKRQRRRRRRQYKNMICFKKIIEKKNFLTNKLLFFLNLKFDSTAVKVTQTHK